MASTNGDLSAMCRDFVHTGPGTLAGQMMRRFWQPVALSRDLAPGRTKAVKLMSEEFTLYRGESGQAYFIGARCAHRRTRLWAGWVEGDCVRCLYHGWKYDGSGQCVEQPAEDPDFASGVRIPSYPTHEYLGLVFVCIGEGAPPTPPRFPLMEGEGVLSITGYVRPCNYFYNVENGVDPAHFAFTHRQRWKTAVANVEAEENEFGVTVRATQPTGEIRVAQWGFPNIIQHPPRSDMAQIGYRVPIDDDQHMSFTIAHTRVTGEEAERYRESERQADARAAEMEDVWEAASAVLRTERTLDEFLEHPRIFNIQDDTAQAGQMPVEERELERHGSSDVAILLQHRVFERELRALAEGRPLKEWRLPEGLAPRLEWAETR